MFSTILSWLTGTLRRQLTVGMTLIATAILLLFVFDTTRREQAYVLELQSGQATELAQSVAHSSAVWLASRDFAGLQEIVGGLVGFPDLRHAMVLDLRGQVLAHSDQALRGQYLTDLPQATTTQILQRSDQLIDVASPVVLSGQTIGWVRIGLGGDALTAKLAQVRRNGLLYVLIAVACSALFASVVANALTRRLRTIQQIADAIQTGDSGLRVHLSGNDEAAQLGRRFNAMLDSLAQQREAVRQLAFYDPLTGLPNRRMLDDRLNQAMETSKRSGLFGTLMFLDLDNFKTLNDTHGHGVGDLLLIEVAKRLTSCVRGVDTVGRIGGDEFVVMLSELDADRAVSTEQAAGVAEKIRLSLAAPYRLTVAQPGVSDTTVEHHCTASIGVVVFVNHEATQTELVKWADSAMYQAKESGRNAVRFHASSA
ncbi:MAG: diguanylate cyclase [Burkholderiales bacterium]